METEPFLLHQLKPQTHGAVLSRAAESIALSSNQNETIVDVLHGRAFRYYAEGLRQYLAVRSGSVEFARTNMSKLRAFVAKANSASLVAPPGIRARLYRAARSYLVDSKAPFGVPSRTDRQELPWRASPSLHQSDNPLNALRFDLKEGDSELLELRFARELSIDELAFVYKEEPAKIASRLEKAKARAELLIDSPVADDERRFRKLIIEAFALQRLTDPSEREQQVEPLPSGTIIGGRYAIQVRVGLGAFGDVYRANDTEVPGHVVALKLLHQPAYSEHARESAFRELRLIASVFHPSIVQFKDHGWHEGRLWFVMPWYEGETLESRMQREPLSRQDARRIFEPLARALAAMHAAGVRHQDVKPDNIFLARLPGFGQTEVLPVLLDLGVAATDAEMVVAGTPTYFAPEVAAQFASVQQRPPVTHKADVFALALSLRNALEPDTQEDVAAGAVEAFIENRAREVPAYPTHKRLRFLDQSWDRWLNDDPDARPSAEELAEELNALTSPEDQKERARNMLRWAAPIIATLSLSGGLAVGVFYEQATSQRQVAEQTRAANEGLREDLADTRSTAEFLQGQVEQGQLTRAQLLSRLERTDKTLKKTKNQLVDKAKRLEQTIVDLETTTKIKDDTIDELKAARVEIESRRQRIVELRGNLAGTRATLKAQELKSAELERAVAQAVAERAQLEAELEQAREELAQSLPAPVTESVTESAPVSEPASEPASEPESASEDFVGPN